MESPLKVSAKVGQRSNTSVCHHMMVHWHFGAITYSSLGLSSQGGSQE